MTCTKSTTCNSYRYIFKFKVDRLQTELNYSHCVVHLLFSDADDTKWGLQQNRSQPLINIDSNMLLICFLKAPFRRRRCLSRIEFQSLAPNLAKKTLVLIQSQCINVKVMLHETIRNDDF